MADKNSSNPVSSNDGSKRPIRIHGHTILSGIRNPRYVKFDWAIAVNLVNTGLPAPHFELCPKRTYAFGPLLMKKELYCLYANLTMSSQVLP